MTTQSQTEIAGTGLRIALGLMYLAHSIVLKYFTFTLAGTAKFFASVGLPPALAYVVFGAEVGGGVLLLIGVQTRIVALALTPILAGALWVHSGNGWVFNSPNGGWEYPLFLIVVSVAVALLAPATLPLFRADARPLPRSAG